jgi:hypothetical protein
VDADRAEHVIDQPQLPVEQPQPQHRRRHRRHQRRQEDDRAVDRLPVDLRVQQQRHPQRDRQPQRQRQDRVIRRVEQHLLEEAVGNELAVILAADEHRPLEERVLAEAVIKRQRHRHDREDAKADQPRRDERHAFEKISGVGTHDRLIVTRASRPCMVPANGGFPAIANRAHGRDARVTVKVYHCAVEPRDFCCATN